MRRRRFFEIQRRCVVAGYAKELLAAITLNGQVADSEDAEATLTYVQDSFDAGVAGVHISVYYQEGNPSHSAADTRARAASQ